MKSADWADSENYRNRCLAQIMELCLQLGLDSNATEKKISIKLPTVDEINVWPEVEKKKRFNVADWGNVDVFGNTINEAAMPDDFQLPENGEILEEGMPPSGDPNQEV